MFHSLHKHNYLSEVVEDPDYWLFKYTLIDDKFGKVSGAAPAAINVPGYATRISAIIVEYSKRGLNVEAQLAIYLLDICKRYDYNLKVLLADYDKSDTQAFQKLWKTVDQKKILRLMVFA